MFPAQVIETSRKEPARTLHLRGILRIRKFLQGPIARATISTSGVLGLRLLMQAGTLLVLAQVLNPVGFGIYAGLGALAVVLGSLASFGTHLMLLRDVARDASAHTDAVRLALGTTALCGSALMCVYLLVSLLWLRPENVGVLTVACLGVSEILLQPALLIAVMSRHARGEIVRSQLLLVIPLTLRLILATAIGWFQPSDPLAVFAVCHLVAVLSALVMAIAAVQEAWPYPWHWLLPQRAQWRDASGYAFLSASTNGVAEMDKLLAIKLLAAGPAGIYAVASRVIGAMVLPVIALVIAAMPRLFRDASRDGHRLQRWVFASALSYGLLAGVSIWVVAPAFQLMLGEKYAGVGDAVRWLAFAVPAISLRAAAVNVLTTIDRPWLRVILELTGWILIVFSAIVFAPPFGVFGMALALAFAEWLLAIFSWLSIYISQRQKSLFVDK